MNKKGRARQAVFFWDSLPCPNCHYILAASYSPTTRHNLPWQNIHIPLVRTEYSGSCLKLCTETTERRIAGDVVRVGYGEDCVDAAVAGN